MYFKRFQNGDKVQYCGEKLASELSGKLGVVLARVQNVDDELVVDFGNGAYIMDENRDLTKFQGREAPVHVPGDKPTKVDKKVAGAEVQKRRGVGGGKRTAASQDSGE
jgi:hypothetical protein